MTVARGEIVTEGVEGIYHCISRCVRRAFLCGEDVYSGKSFEHRKSWVESRLELLSKTFAIQVCAFAVMSNHLHVVLRTRPDWVEDWSDYETARRWLLLFPKRKTPQGKPLPPSPAEIKALFKSEPGIDVIRERLASVSWFMRSLNENIARRANKEDGCKGRFWEGRFKCQVLLDESALLTCMTYVDLNPVRCGAALSPETSRHTSAFLRIRARQAGIICKSGTMTSDAAHLTSHNQLENPREETKTAGAGHWLCPFDTDDQAEEKRLLDLGLDQYLDLLDWTGRQLRENGKKSIPDEYKPILERLRVDSDKWLDAVNSYGGGFYRAAGREEHMRRFAGELGLKWLKGLSAGRKAFF